MTFVVFATTLFRSSHSTHRAGPRRGTHHRRVAVDRVHVALCADPAPLGSFADMFSQNAAHRAQHATDLGVATRVCRLATQWRLVWVARPFFLNDRRRRPGCVRARHAWLSPHERVAHALAGRVRPISYVRIRGPPAARLCAVNVTELAPAHATPTAGHSTRSSSSSARRSAQSSMASTLGVRGSRRRFLPVRSFCRSCRAWTSAA